MRRLLILLALAMPSAAPAQDVVASYVAFIGQDDLYNSDGARLSAPWQVLRQDRANLHRFGISQPGDEWDPVFADAENRAAMEAMVRGGSMTAPAAQAIMAGGAMVVVTVWGKGGLGTAVDVDVYR